MEKTIIYRLIVFLVYFPICAWSITEKQISDNIFKDYDKKYRPVKDITKQMKVVVMLDFIELVGIVSIGFGFILSIVL